jgi:hypothetical protein
MGPATPLGWLACGVALLGASILMDLSGCYFASGLSDFEVVAGGAASGGEGGAGAGGDGGSAASGGSGGTAGAGGAGVVVLDLAVSQPSDDAEECMASGDMNLHSSDLELGEEQNGWGAQMVGIRFQQVTIPYASTILSARLDLVVNESGGGPTDLVIHGHASGQAFPFLNVSTDLTARDLTTASVDWTSVPAWDQLGATQSSPELRTIVQELVDEQGWQAQSLVLLIKGTGRRTAVAFNGSANDAPSLHIEYLAP